MDAAPRQFAEPRSRRRAMPIATRDHGGKTGRKPGPLVHSWAVSAPGWRL